MKKVLFCMMAVVLLTVLLINFALAVDETVYQLVMGMYEGSYIQFMIFNFGYAPVITLEPETKVYSSPAHKPDDMITVLPNAGTLLIALKYATQGAGSSALLYDLKDGNLEKLGYVSESDIEVLELQMETD